MVGFLGGPLKRFVCVLCVCVRVCLSCVRVRFATGPDPGRGGVRGRDCGEVHSGRGGQHPVEPCVEVDQVLVCGRQWARTIATPTFLCACSPPTTAQPATTGPALPSTRLPRAGTPRLSTQPIRGWQPSAASWSTPPAAPSGPSLSSCTSRITSTAPKVAIATGSSRVVWRGWGEGLAGAAHGGGRVERGGAGFTGQ